LTSRPPNRALCAQSAPLISHTLPLTDFPNAPGVFARGETLKVQLRP
jgi:hypothetical protein